MINDELFAKFDSIEELPISEEMLGAYMEGNANPNEVLQIEFEMSEDSDLSSFVYELEHDRASILDNLENQIFDPDYPHFLSDIELPGIENDSFHHSFYEDHMVAACCPDDFPNDVNPLSSGDLHNADDFFEYNLSSEDRFGIEDQSLDIDSPEECDDMFNNDSIDI